MPPKRRLKIAYLSDTFTPQINGVVTSILTFKKELEKRGHEVLVICPKSESDQDSTDDVWRFRSLPYPFQSEHRITSPISRKLKTFKEKEIDIVHIQTPFFMGHLGLYLGWKHKTPMVHTYHTYWYEYLHYFPLLPEKLRKKADLLLLTTKFCNRCEHIVVPSEQMKEKLLIDKVTAPLSVIPTGIAEKPTPSEDEKKAFRDRYGLKDTDRTGIFVGRLGKEKNVDFLLDAYLQIQKKHSDLKLLVVGDGPERKVMEKQLKKAGLADSVIFTGYLDHSEVFLAYSVSTLILFPSKTETQGLSLLEGLSSGIPAVCLNVMGVKDVMGDGKGGLLVEDAIPDFVDAANQLLSDPVLYKEKQEGARLQAEAFSSAKMAERLESVYYDVLEKEGEKS